MKYKSLIKALGFTPKENTSGVFSKKYSSYESYEIEVDFENEKINYGDKIVTESRTTQNFAQDENWVVLECVNRLLEKKYPPQNIILEKTWATGHGTSGRLDILVTRDDDSAYLMIECKTWGTEFEKALNKLQKPPNGGQLFTYFQQDKNADILMLYASELDVREIQYKNVIVKIEDDHRQTANVKDFYERWNEQPKTNGIFNGWVSAYEFQSKALTRKDLKVLKHEDSNSIFNQFLKLLRHNVVSDKPNAFNKIFTLFLCKIVDENRTPNDQLHFQWLEGEDNYITFQKRLTDLYRRGMKELLEKKVTDVSDDEFDTRFQQVEERYRDEIKDILTEIRLKKNNEFAIKEVFDDASFEENAKVVKEVVELLQVYQIRYNCRQQFLSDFFELLLTTGLKQESGQFFTPVPIARFIIKSLPLQEIAAAKIEQGDKNNLLPTIIDYAAGSGHFLTESMEEVQKYIDVLDLDDFKPETKKQLDGFRRVQFDWAEKYVYGIEKDYRLVKTAKVSCYLHGDGLAKVIHGDGLGDFATSTEFKDLLKETDRTYTQDNKQFDIIISNPPYSVSAFKGLMDEAKSKKGFDLFDRLTDQSSEIECLFIERTKQLLKDGGVAGIVLPSSILSNTGIYTQAREIILKYFDIVAIAEMGSNTFMATGTNTVTLFLRRRNNAYAFNIEEAVKKFFTNLQDVTINGIEKPIEKYISHVWEGLSLGDYKTLIQKTPNEKVRQHEIYQEYRKKIKGQNEQEQWKGILAVEQEKLTYFIITHPQKLVLLKTGKKNEEKRFLGYKFSSRRGSQGIHPIQRSKTIDECTQLYDASTFENPEKASTYVYKAFNGELDLELPECLQPNLSYHNLVDMLTFDRVDFEKSISLSVKKKVKIESKWEKSKLADILEILESGKRPKGGVGEYQDGVPSLGGEHIDLNGRIKISKNNLKFVPQKYFDGSKQGILENIDILICKDGALTGKTALFYKNEIDYSQSMINEHVFLLRTNDKSVQKYLFNFLFSQNGQELLKANISGQAQGGLNRINLLNIKIPLPPKDIQEKIVAEIEFLEEGEEKAVNKVKELKNEIKNKANILYDEYPNSKLGLLCKNPLYGANESAANGDPKKDYRYIRITDISDDGHLKKEWVTAKKVDKKYILKDGDFLFARSGATAGKTFLYKSKYGKAIYAGYLIKFPVKQDKLSSSFLNFILKSDNYKNWILGIRKGAAQPNINAQQYSSFQIPLLSILEQKKIVQEIEKTETKIAELEKQIAQVPNQKEQILKKHL